MNTPLSQKMLDKIEADARLIEKKQLSITI